LPLKQPCKPTHSKDSNQKAARTIAIVKYGYLVTYEDGDCETMSPAEVRRLLLEDSPSLETSMNSAKRCRMTLEFVDALDTNRKRQKV
jgi:hypothetical protein